MNAYELAEIMTVHDGSKVWEHGLEIANTLRQQADLIRNLQKSLGFKNSGYETINLTPQTKPLSDEEMKELINNFPIIFSPQDLLSFARAIEERHGIK